MRVLWLAVGALMVVALAGYSLLGYRSTGWVVACRDSQAGGLVDALSEEGARLVWESVTEVDGRLNLSCPLSARVVIPLPGGLNHTVEVGRG
ncbi:MAG: hypothetical protein QI223_00860 [Candidatus Korarchaeota archaeon]|nr:hypothetical protein [Candidatus Korarchaeota archaeon]